MLNDRKGGYSTPFGLSESYADATFGDFDHNALTDMVLSNGSGLWTVPQFIPGGFGSPIGPWKEYREIMRPHAVDLDRDGATDLVSLQCEPLSFGCSWPFLWVHLQWTGLLVDAPERPYLEISNISQFDRQAFAHGDINSDGCTDVLFVAHTTGLVIKNGRNCSATRPVHNDFDGDRKSDLLWHDAATGMSDLWQGASLDQRRIMANVNPTMWELVDTGDFDNDSKADMLWRNRTTGANIVWRAGNYRVSYPLGTLADTAWHVAGSGDFNGDRKTDLLWRNTSTGANMVWTSSNVVFTAQLAAMPDPSWRVIGIGDFDGDGRDDVFWRNVATGKNAIWKSANANTAIATGRRGGRVAGLRPRRLRRRRQGRHRVAQQDHGPERRVALRQRGDPHGADVHHRPEVADRCGRRLRQRRPRGLVVASRHLRREHDLARHELRLPALRLHRRTPLVARALKIESAPDTSGSPIPRLWPTANAPRQMPRGRRQDTCPCR